VRRRVVSRRSGPTSPGDGVSDRRAIVDRDRRSGGIGQVVDGAVGRGAAGLPARGLGSLYRALTAAMLRGGAPGVVDGERLVAAGRASRSGREAVVRRADRRASATRRSAGRT
jgi:hypothetical protein